MEKKQNPSSYDLFQPVYVPPVHSISKTQTSPVAYVMKPAVQPLAPNHFLGLSVVAMIVLTIPCPLSLAFTVPALMLSLLVSRMKGA